MLNYIFIFFAKILEVSLMTLRTVLITRGERLYAALIGAIEVSIWLYVISTVLIGIKEDPIKMVVYALGFSCGNIIGSLLEEKLAIGLLTIHVITDNVKGDILADRLRKSGLGITKIMAQGKDNEKYLLIIHAKRKRKNEIVKIIEKEVSNAVISVYDTKTVYGGYGLLRK